MATDADLLVEVHLNRRFRGKFATGITTSSTTEDVFEAYGEPVDEEEVKTFFRHYDKFKNRTLYKKDETGRIAYRDMGLPFWFDGDNIKEIAIGRI